MFYLKINEKILELILLCSDIKLGCRDYCKYKLIALDELELLRIELENKKLKKFTNEEFDLIKKSTENVYFHQVHVCIHDNKLTQETFTKETTDENDTDFNSEIDTMSKPDFTKERKKPDVINKFRVTYDFSDKTEDEKILQNNAKKGELNENTFSYGISMIGSFFLLVLGSYYLGKDYLGWSQSSTLILTLIVTIVVFFAESFLLIIKLNKQTSNVKATENIKKYSLAYRLNANYRNSFVNAKKKVSDVNKDKNKEKKD